MGEKEILKSRCTTEVRLNNEHFRICYGEKRTEEWLVPARNLLCSSVNVTWKYILFSPAWEDSRFTVKFSPSTAASSSLKVFRSVVFVPPQLALEDPVHSVSLHQFVYEKLKAQQTLLGDQGFGVLMETVDTELVRQLQEFLQGFWITSTILHYFKNLCPVLCSHLSLKMY